MEDTARARRGPEDGGRVPGHVPQLHRALAAAVEDIDAVEDQLSKLFERTDRRGDRKGDGSDPFATLDDALAAEEPDGGHPRDGRRMRVFRRKGTGPA